MPLRPTRQRIQQPGGGRRGRERAALTLAFVVVVVTTAAWLIGLFLAIRWLVTAIF